MFRHLKCHPQGIQCALLTLHTDFSGLSKIKLLKYKIMNFNKILIVQRHNEPRYLYVILVKHNELPEDEILNVETCRSMLFVIIVINMIVQSLVKL